MKTIFLLTLLSVTTGYSQDSLFTSRSDKSEAVVNKLTRELSLAKNQQEKVYQLLEKRWGDLEKARTSKGNPAGSR